MSDSNQQAAPSPTGKSAPPLRSRVLDWLLIVVGVAFLAYFGLRTWQYQQARSRGLTGEVMPGLAEAERIPLESGAAKDFNVVVISMDTTRADHLGCYGNGGVKTPNIDGMAGEGVLFASAFTPSPSTLPGHSTIFTGLYPNHHGARANGTFTLDGAQLTLAEILKTADYRTGAVISAYVLDSRFGLDQGFDDFNDDLSKGVKHADHAFRERPAEFSNEAALGWLDAHGGGKFFLWIHYFDVHAPYLPPEPYRSEYQTRLYDGEIAYVDHAIGQVLAKLDALGVRDRTLVVLAGDHGESLGEHKERTHALLIYDATMHTPLIFHCPGLIDGGHVVRAPVTNAAIVPTVLDALGVHTDAAFDGVSLLRPSSDWPATLYGESIATLVLHGWSPLFSVRDRNYKYIHAPKPELYDLKTDPRELNNLFAQAAGDPDVAAKIAELSAALDQVVGEDKFGASALEQVVEMDPETAEQLAALGYVSSKSGNSLDVDAAAQRDPKDMIEDWENIQRALDLQSAGQNEEAITLLEGAVEAAPGDVFALRNLATSYVNVGRIEDAEAALLQALEHEKNEPGIYASLGRIAARRRDLDKAREYLERAREVDPNYAQVYVDFGALEAMSGNVEGAEALYRKAIEIDPGTTGPMAYFELGMMYARLLRPADARTAFESALAIDALNGPAHAGLASILADEGKYDEARAEFDKAVKFEPNQPTAFAALAGLHMQQGDYEKAKVLAERALALDADNAAALNNLALATKRAGDMDQAIEFFKKAIEVQPNDLACRLNLALCYYALRDEERAVEEYREVLKINPRTPKALANLGVYHESHGRLDKALEFYRRAVEADPDYAYAHAHLAAMLLQHGQVPAALEHFKKSLELDPEQADREKLLTQIEQLEQRQRSSPPDQPDAADSNGS